MHPGWLGADVVYQEANKKMREIAMTTIAMRIFTLLAGLGFGNHFCNIDNLLVWRVTYVWAPVRRQSCKEGK